MKVSVIIPVFNEEKYLDKCIQSVISQRQTGEILLIDDQSTDNSLKICQQWAENDHRIRVLVNEGMKGAGGAMNTGLHQATCEYVAFLGADDYYLANRFEAASSIFEKHHDVEVVSDSMQILTYDSKDHERLNMLLKHGSIVGFHTAHSYINVHQQKQILGLPITGLTIKREVIDKTGYFDEELKQAQDTDLVVRMLQKAIFMSGNVETPVVVYFIHEQNTTTNYQEAIYYRRRKAKKHFQMAIQNKMGYQAVWKYFKNFVEYDYLWLFGRNHRYKKTFKTMLLPYFGYRILTKKDPPYDSNRAIDLS